MDLGVVILPTEPTSVLGIASSLGSPEDSPPADSVTVDVGSSPAAVGSTHFSTPAVGALSHRESASAFTGRVKQIPPGVSSFVGRARPATVSNLIDSLGMLPFFAWPFTIRGLVTTGAEFKGTECTGTGEEKGTAMKEDVVEGRTCGWEDGLDETGARETAGVLRAETEEGHSLGEGKKLLQEEVGGLQEEVRGLQEEVGGLQEEVGGLEKEVGGLQEEVGVVEI